MARQFYSRAHYRLVSPPPDTAADVADRLRRQRASTLAVGDREAAFPELTAENAAEAIAYQDARYAHHYSQAGAHREPATRPRPPSRRAPSSGR